jgi:hypothetical protein
MPDEVFCGYLIKLRDGSGGMEPCMLKPLHKNKRHRDAEYIEAQRARNRSYARRVRIDRMLDEYR